MLHVFLNLAESTVQGTSDRDKSRNQRKRSEQTVKRKYRWKTGSRNAGDNKYFKQLIYVSKLAAHLRKLPPSVHVNRM